MSAMASVLSEYIPQLAYGKYADPKAAIDEMREKLKAAGYDKVKESIQKNMDEYKASIKK
jgi:putative aldouronate transport system substrate-binding protein